MNGFKIICPYGYQIRDTDNDNLDLNIIIPYGTVFFTTFFTLSNIDELMKKENESYFWATDMVVVKNFEKETIREAVFKVLENVYTEHSFSKTGTIQTVYPGKQSYEEIVSDI